MPIASWAIAAALSTLLLPPADEQAAMFAAAGFSKAGEAWRTKDCEGLEGASYSPGQIDSFGDGNRDGFPDAVISESSAICYGMAGSRFWLLAKDAAGQWRVLASEIGMPDFLSSNGVDGWPDVQVGGPGFCFPVLRWDGRAYRLNRHEYEGKACKPERP